MLEEDTEGSDVELIAPYTIVASGDNFVRLDIYTGKTWWLDMSRQVWIPLYEQDESGAGIAFEGLK